MLEDVTITNVVMRDIADSPIFIRLGSRGRGPKEHPKVGALRRVNISNVIVYNADSKYASIISGIPGHPIENITLSNIRIHYRGGGTADQAKSLPPEKESAYPEPEMFGQPMPAYGFFIRHVKGITMTDVEVSFMKEDFRAPFVLVDVADADFYRVKAQTMPSVKTFVLRDVSDFNTFRVWRVPDITIDQAKHKEL